MVPPGAQRRQARAFGLLALYSWVFLALALLHYHPPAASGTACLSAGHAAAEHALAAPSGSIDPECRICSLGSPPPSAPAPPAEAPHREPGSPPAPGHAAAVLAARPSPVLPRAPPAGRSVAVPA